MELWWIVGDSESAGINQEVGVSSEKAGGFSKKNRTRKEARALYLDFAFSRRCGQTEILFYESAATPRRSASACQCRGCGRCLPARTSPA